MPDAPPGSLPAGTRLAHYEIAGLIGAGGMGHVYRARDLKLQREVALKLLPGDMAADPSAASGSSAKRAPSPPSITPASSPSFPWTTSTGVCS
jgi:serine/threonine protein kinase